MKYFKMVLISTFLLSSTAFSEEKNYDFKRNETTFQMLGNDFVSPVSESHTTAILIGSSAIILEALIFKDQNKKLVRDISTSKPLGKYSKDFELMGQVVPNIAYAVYNGAVGTYTKDSKSLYLAGLMARATFSSALTTNILKYTVREKRPDPSTAKNGFPSGHTTTAFAFASVVGYQHGPWWGGASYLMASLVGFSRLNDNAHYAHEVVAGAFIGTLYGISISQRDEKFLATSNQNNKTTFDFYPIFSDKIAGMHLDASF